MSENEKDLSQYISFISSDMQLSSVIAGFVFTAITLLVTLLPDPSQVLAQATLFSLFVVFLLAIGGAWSGYLLLTYCVRVAPPLPEGFRKRSDLFGNFIWLVLGIPLVLMFLLWNLTYLALGAVIIEALFDIIGYFHAKPLRKIRQKFEAETKKKWRVRKFFDERDNMFESEK